MFIFFLPKNFACSNIFKSGSSYHFEYISKYGILKLKNLIFLMLKPEFSYIFETF